VQRDVLAEQRGADCPLDRRRRNPVLLEIGRRGHRRRRRVTFDCFRGLKACASPEDLLASRKRVGFNDHQPPGLRRTDSSMVLHRAEVVRGSITFDGDPFARRSATLFASSTMRENATSVTCEPRRTFAGRSAQASPVRHFTGLAVASWSQKITGSLSRMAA
jgi:hypothetical protein